MATSVGDVRAPLLHAGKVRELFDLGEHLLLVATDRVSAHDLALRPPIPHKGRVLTRLSEHWFARTASLQAHHLVHADVGRIVAAGFLEPDLAPRYEGRVMVARRAERIDVECVVRGHLTGAGWRQYERAGTVNGIRLAPGLRKNQRLDEPIFTPAIKNDVGHDEDIPFERLVATVGRDTAVALRDASLALYAFARADCEARGVILADGKMEFGRIDGELVLIDELFTPDSARFWDAERFALDVEIDSMDKEPIRQHLLAAQARDGTMPTTLPDAVVQATSRRYLEILHRLTGIDAQATRP